MSVHYTESIKQLEADIARHRENMKEELRIMTLKTRRRNGLLPVSRLPTELLAIIFTFFARDPLGWKRGRVGLYNWITVTHVCHQWRMVALNAPRLWNYIFLGRPERVKLFLERSRQAPLTIVPWTSKEIENHGRPSDRRFLSIKPPPAQAESLKLILNESHRIQSLSVDLDPGILAKVFGAFDEGGFHAPILDTIKFTCEETRPFPNILSRTFLPSLAHVELRGYPVPWSLPFLHTHLTSLVIDHFNDVSSKPSVFTVTSPMKELLICLSYMPRLRFLDVNAEHCYNDCELVDSFANNMPFVELSCLEEVSMKLEVASVFEFVTHCKFPTSARRSFVTTVRHSHPPKGVADDDSLSSIVISSTPFSSDVLRVEDREPPITGLSIVFHSPPPIVYHSPFFSPPSLLPMGLEEHRMCRVSIATHRCNFQFDDTTYAFPRHSLPPTHFSLEFDSPNSVVIALLNLFTQPPFKLSDLAYLNIHGEQQDQWEQIGPMLSAALTQLIRQCSKPCLEFLRLSGSGVDILLHLLTSFSLPSPSQKGDGSRSLFSHIRTLVINKTISEYMWHSCKTDGARMDDLCAEIHSQVELHEWSSGPFTTLILEFVKISRERLRRLVHSFSHLFGQEGRYVAIEEPPETDSMPPTPTMPPTVPSTPLAPLKPLPDCLEVNDLDELNLETCVELEFEDGEKIYRLPTERPSPVPRPRPVLNPVDWRDYATHGRVVFDFKNVEMKIVRRHQLQVERAV